MENVESKIYLTIDCKGNKTYACCEDSSNSIQISGMVDTNGKDLYFDSNAYHLSPWCEENGIQLRVIERAENFDELWVASL